MFSIEYAGTMPLTANTRRQLQAIPRRRASLERDTARAIRSALAQGASLREIAGEIGVVSPAWVGKLARRYDEELAARHR